jgi:serine/threonine-protein kinase
MMPFIDWAPGMPLGPYVLLAHVGAGGMGEVWKARDPRVDRFVAIKRLKEEDAERFRREARAIAALNHPHICQLYDVGPDYLVMEYVDGQPLKGPMPAADALRLAAQIANALAEAHRKGVVHRDLKPSNILVNESGAKLVDFGLAKMDAPTLSSDPTGGVALTRPGVIMGTMSYMSPEQALGEAVDARSDVFSFGAVLYELLSGRQAFLGDTPFATITAVVSEEPPALEAPADLGRIVRRCLAKEPRDRFQSMMNVLAALEEAAINKLADRQPSLAVLPFANMSRDRDDEYFSDGLAEELINLLAHIPNLKVTARTSAFAFRGKEQDVRRIAEALGVRMILEGSVRRAGSRIRVTAQLISAEDGYHVWSERYDRELTDVFAIQDEIAQAIATALQINLAARFAHSRHTPTIPAYEAMLKGRHHMMRNSRESAARAVDCFKQAMALDPGFAEPHASLGFNYFLSALLGMGSLKDMMPLVGAEATEALHLQPSDPGPHFLLGAVAAAYEYDWKKAGEHFRVATAGPSVSAEAHWAYASLYLQPLGRFEDAVFQMERAVERDPLNAMWRGVFTSHLTHAGLYDRAIDQSKEASSIDPTHLVPFANLGEAYVTMGRWPEAIGALEQAYQIAPRFALSTGMLAGALVRIGERMRAEELIREMGDAPQPVIGRVLYHVLCSEMEPAADWYERAIEQRDPFALIFANTPLLGAFRQTARWQKLARMMNLPEP